METELMGTAQPDVPQTSNAIFEQAESLCNLVMRLNDINRVRLETILGLALYAAEKAPTTGADHRADFARPLKSVLEALLLKSSEVLAGTMITDTAAPDVSSDPVEQVVVQILREEAAFQQQLNVIAQAVLVEAVSYVLEPVSPSAS